jgi:hypothetical protein
MIEEIRKLGSSCVSIKDFRELSFINSTRGERNKEIKIKKKIRNKKKKSGLAVGLLQSVGRATGRGSIPVFSDHEVCHALSSVCEGGERETSDLTTTNLHWNIDKITNELWRWGEKRGSPEVPQLSRRLWQSYSFPRLLNKVLGFFIFYIGRKKERLCTPLEAREEKIKKEKGKEKKKRGVESEKLYRRLYRKLWFLFYAKRFICRLLFRHQMRWYIIHHNI